MAALFGSVPEVGKKNLVKRLGITSREYHGQGLGGTVTQIDLFKAYPGKRKGM